MRENYIRFWSEVCLLCFLKMTEKLSSSNIWITEMPHYIEKEKPFSFERTPLAEKVKSGKIPRQERG